MSRRKAIYFTDLELDYVQSVISAEQDTEYGSGMHPISGTALTKLTKEMNSRRLP